MAFKLFGGGPKKENTPHGTLQYMIRSVCEGNMEEAMNAFQIGEGPRARVNNLPGVVRGYLSTYVKKLFKQSAFEVGAVEMQGDNLAAVTVSGRTLDGKKTADDALEIIGTRGKEIGLFDGKRNLRMVGQALGMVDDVLKKLQIGPVRGVVHMEKVDGEWQVRDRDELTQVLVRASISELMPEMQEKFQKIKDSNL